MTETLHTDQDYRIVRHRDGAAPGYIRGIGIEHLCEHYGGSGGSRRWYLVIWLTEARALECSMCKRRPSEGLQASFWFLKEGTE